MAYQTTAVMPMIPLPKGSVLFPGLVQRIPASADRADIPALFSSVYAQASANHPNKRIDSVLIVCTPSASHLLGKTGQRLVDDSKKALRSKPEGTNGELFGFGVASVIRRVEGKEGGEFALLVEGAGRVRIDEIVQEQPHYTARVTSLPEEIAISDAELQLLFDRLKYLARELIVVLTRSPRSNGSSLSQLQAARIDLFIFKRQLHEAGSLADFMASIVEASFEEKLEVLAAIDVKERVKKVIALLEIQMGNIHDKGKTIAFSTTLPRNADIDRNKPPRNDQVTIRIPFNIAGMSMPPHMPGNMAGNRGSKGGDDHEQDDAEELQRRIKEARLSPEAAKVAERELRRLKNMNPGQADYQVTRNYIENLTEIPWTITTDEHLGRDTLTKARKQLDDDHYGLDKVKKRLVEYLAVLRLKQNVNEELEQQIKRAEQEIVTLEVGKEDKGADYTPSPDTYEKIKASSIKLDILRGRRMVDKSPILLLAGPPGVGKTSLAKSIATALGRKFHRISLGGVHDEAEIRGHRRTYVAAMPGLIVHGLKKVGVANPVFLLDELDKVGMSKFQGDPAAALLEVLDPEQNHSFVDHYVNVPIDLSRVLFIATANSLETIPPALLDRMETIQLPGYTTLEKRRIASQHLIPKQVRTNGLAPDQITFPGDVVAKIIESYTRESGVRNLEREIGSVCRAKAVEYADASDNGHPEKYDGVLTPQAIEDILGIVKFEEELTERANRPGIVTGLVAYSFGGNGSILFIEVADMPGSGTVQLTGKLGDVLKESVEVALTWVKAHAFELGLTKGPHENIMKDRSIHVHCPSGAIPKDGPSSGIGQAIALVSLFSGQPVPPTMAMTGEISLRGRVTAVGGIKEKLIGALRAGVKTVLLPEQNRKDVRDLPDEVQHGLEIIHVRHIWEAIHRVWPEARWPGQHDIVEFESHL